MPVATVCLYRDDKDRVPVLSWLNGLIKESEVTPAEIKRALERKALYQQDPVGHTYEEDLRDG